MTARTELLPVERKLIARLLSIADEEFGNHCCNDLNLEEVGLSEEESRDLVIAYHDWNGDPEEVAEVRNWHWDLPDFALMAFMAHKLDPQHY